MEKSKSKFIAMNNCNEHCNGEIYIKVHCNVKPCSISYSLLHWVVETDIDIVPVIVILVGGETSASRKELVTYGTFDISVLLKICIHLEIQQLKWVWLCQRIHLPLQNRLWWVWEFFVIRVLMRGQTPSGSEYLVTYWARKMSLFSLHITHFPWSGGVNFPVTWFRGDIKFITLRWVGKNIQ